MAAKRKCGGDVVITPIRGTGHGDPGLSPIGRAKNYLEIVARGPSRFTFDPAVLAIDKTHPGWIYWNIGGERGTLPGLAPIGRVRDDCPWLLPRLRYPRLCAGEKVATG